MEHDYKCRLLESIAKNKGIYGGRSFVLHNISRRLSKNNDKDKNLVTVFAGCQVSFIIEPSEGKWSKIIRRKWDFPKVPIYYAILKRFRKK